MAVSMNSCKHVSLHLHHLQILFEPTDVQNLHIQNTTEPTDSIWIRADDAYFVGEIYTP